MFASWSFFVPTFLFHTNTYEHVHTPNKSRKEHLLLEKGLQYFPFCCLPLLRKEIVKKEKKNEKKTTFDKKKGYKSCAFSYYTYITDAHLFTSIAKLYQGKKVIIWALPTLKESFFVQHFFWESIRTPLWSFLLLPRKLTSL